MAPIRSLAAATLLLSAANAHFSLVAPTPLEGDSMNEDLQPNGPCGGGVANLDENTATDFHVGGDAVALMLGHPQANFLIRATLDSGAQGNWTQLFPIYMQSGRGSFCEPAVTAPEEWAGQKGIIGIACAAPDGMLFQCAAVNFVSGTNTSPGSCTNGSSVSASFRDDPDLTALLDGSPTDSNPPESTSDSAAPSLMARGSLPIGSLVVSAAMVLVGAALL